jgi:hypothetical protein
MLLVTVLWRVGLLATTRMAQVTPAIIAPASVQTTPTVTSSFVNRRLSPY